MDRKLVISSAALSGVEAGSTPLPKGKREQTEREKEFDAIVKSCVLKDKHVCVPTDKPRLYTVTTITCCDRHGGTRTPVICDSFERACEIVETNEGGIWEWSYHLVVVESVRPNYLYNIGGTEQYWYRWDFDEECYKPVEIPEAYKNVIGWGIG